MGKTYGEWLLRWRYLVMVATIALVAGAASGMRFLEFKTDYRVFFSRNNPQLQAFEQLQNTYTKTDNVLFVLAPRDGKVFTRETLASVVRLTQAAWQIPYSIRVDSLTNYQHTEADADDLVVDDLVSDVEGLDDAALRRIRNIAVHEPLLVDRLVSADGRVTGVNVAFSTVGMAMGVTSVVLIAGFLILTLSPFRLNSDMGLLTAITIAFALAADFLFLPPLLMKVDK